VEQRMNTETTELSEFARMVHGIQTAIVMTNPTVEGKSGVFDLNEAIDALMWTAADLLVRSGTVSTPRACRLEGEELGKKLARVMKISLETKERGEMTTWEMEPVGKPS
jgi:hypothetical protein